MLSGTRALDAPGLLFAGGSACRPYRKGYARQAETCGYRPAIVNFGAAVSIPRYRVPIATSDTTGRVVGSGQRGFIDGDTPRLLAQLGVAPGEWLKNVTALQARYELAIGAPERLRDLAAVWATKWVRGIRFARRLYPARAG